MQQEGLSPSSGAQVTQRDPATQRAGEPSPQSAADKARVVGIDVVRFAGIIALVFAHVSVGKLSPATISLVMFPVQFFFVMSGYFFAKPGPSLASDAARICRRLLIPYAVWLAVYVVWFRPPKELFQSVRGIVYFLVDPKPAYHLWYLSSLIFCSLLLLVLLRARLSLKALVAIAVCLYLTGMVFGQYYRPLTGSSEGVYVWNTRNGPFFGFPFMVAGVVIARYRLLPPLWICLAMFLGGGALQYGEIRWFESIGIDFTTEPLVGTVPFGIGAFFLAQHIPVSPAALRIAQLGRYSLGLYLVHLLFYDALRRLSFRGYFLDIKSLAGCSLAIVLVLVASSVFVLVAGRIRWLKPLVR